MKTRPSISRITLVAAASTAMIFGALSVRAVDTVAAPGAPAAAVPAKPQLTYSANEVVKMYQSGIASDVILNYVNNSMLPFHLDADAIIYLHSMGLPPQVLTACLQRDGQLQQQTAYQQQQQPPPGAQLPPGAIATPSTLPPGVNYAYPDSNYVPPPAVAPAYPGYDYDYYDYPYYGYGYGWPPIYVGGWGGWGGWGHGFYGRGFGGRGFAGHGGFEGHGGFGGAHGGGGFHGGGGGFHGGGGGHR